MSPLRGVAKGNAFARKVADYLGTEPRTLSGAKDRGDLVHPTWTVEVKAPGRGRPLDLSTAMNEAKREAANASTHLYCVVSRRTAYPLEEAFVTIPLWMARQVVSGLGFIPAAAIVDVPTGDTL
jgi:hypothetical protein